MPGRISRHYSHDLGAHGNPGLPGREIEVGLARSTAGKMQLGAIDERCRLAMRLGESGDKRLPGAEPMNLGCSNNLHQEMPGPVISRRSLR